MIGPEAPEKVKPSKKTAGPEYDDDSSRKTAEHKYDDDSWKQPGRLRARYQKLSSELVAASIDIYYRTRLGVEKGMRRYGSLYTM